MKKTAEEVTNAENEIYKLIYQLRLTEQEYINLAKLKVLPMRKIKNGKYRINYGVGN